MYNETNITVTLDVSSASPGATAVVPYTVASNNMLTKQTLPVCALIGSSILTSCSGGSGSRGTESSSAPSPAHTPAAAAPAQPQFGTLSVAPATGGGGQATFRVTLSRPTGAPPPHLIGLLLNADMRGDNACYVFRNVEAKETLLVNDSGVGSKEMGKSPSISNKQCTVSAAGTTSSLTATTADIQFDVRFQPGFNGQKKIFLIAQDANGAGPGLQQAGEWTVR